MGSLAGTHLPDSTLTKNVRPSLWSTRMVSPSFTWPSTLSICSRVRAKHLDAIVQRSRDTRHTTRHRVWGGVNLICRAPSSLPSTHTTRQLCERVTRRSCTTLGHQPGLALKDRFDLVCELRQWQSATCTARRKEMATRSTDASDDHPVDTSSKAEPIKQAGADGGGEVEVEGKAPVHDASDTGHKAPTAMQSQNKADLAKVAQRLREDATEGERPTNYPRR